VADAKALKAEFAALIQNGNQRNKGYLERLSQAAAEAAERGYGIQRSTHTVQRTRIQKTTTTTDMRTMRTTTNTERSCKVESWIEEGSPANSGVSILCARGKRVVDRYSDGTLDVKEKGFRGKAMFFPGGDKNSMCTYHFGTGDYNYCEKDGGAAWGSLLKGIAGGASPQRATRVSMGSTLPKPFANAPAAAPA
jgi:hypothetical protein